MVLAVKALVPQGYMASPGKTLTIAICSGQSASQMTIAVPMEHRESDREQDKTAHDQACPFASLSHAAAPGADAALLLTALAFILTLGFTPRLLPPLRRQLYLQPPLRGPPSIA